MRRAAALLLVAFAAALVAGCGEKSVPKGDVAIVGDAGISKDVFNHWLAIAAKGQQTPGKKHKNGIPKPGTPEYNQLKDQAMGFLINAYWIQAEAKDRGIAASAQELDKKFADTKKQFFPKQKDFEKFLKRSGQTVEDVRFRVNNQLLGDKVREEVTKGDDKVTDKEVQDYYNKNRQQFSQPERRNVNAVLTKTKATAEQAKSQIVSGVPFKQAAKQFSSDPSLKTSGGKLAGVTRGQNDKAFDGAVFSAPKGRLGGPLKTQFGYYVFEVTKIEKAKTTPYSKAQGQIRQTLVAQRQQKSLDGFVKDFEKTWKGKTICAQGYIVQSCKNAPKPKTNTAAPPQAPSGGGTPQQPGGGTPQQPGGGTPQQPGGGTPQQPGGGSGGGGKSSR